jgi:uncharacterized protein YjlB
VLFGKPFRGHYTHHRRQPGEREESQIVRIAELHPRVYEMMNENVKRLVENITGLGKPEVGHICIRSAVPSAFGFADDGETPNNPQLPLVLYRSPVVLEPRYDPAAIFEGLFAFHRWENSWRYTMYGFNHFHTRTHECLGIARGALTARFGGREGQEIELKAGDVIVIPAGVGHRHIRQSEDLLIVGAYPVNGGKYDEPKPGEIAHATALAHIKAVPLPAMDPVYGRDGPLFSAWQRR